MEKHEAISFWEYLRGDDIEVPPIRNAQYFFQAKLYTDGSDAYITPLFAKTSESQTGLGAGDDIRHILFTKYPEVHEAALTDYQITTLITPADKMFKKYDRDFRRSETTRVRQQRAIKAAPRLFELVQQITDVSLYGCNHEISMRN